MTRTSFQTDGMRTKRSRRLRTAGHRPKMRRGEPAWFAHPPSVYVIILCMSAVAVVKLEPKSEGIATPRKKRPKELAIITECCTGCAGSPACVPYCPVADCMYWVPDEEHPPFGHIEVDPVLCIGCKKCTSKGPDGAFLDGCPWDAIEMVPIEEVEAAIGFRMTV
jgi:ferredoxin